MAPPAPDKVEPDELTVISPELAALSTDKLDMVAAVLSAEEAPCLSCRERKLDMGHCAIEERETCAVLDKLLARAARLAEVGADAAAIADAITYPDLWFELDVPDDAPILGPASAPITIQVWLAPADPSAAHAWTAIDALRQRFGSKVRFVYRAFTNDPIQTGVLAAGVQHRAWELARAVTAHQGAEITWKLANLAASTGLDIDRWRRDRNSATVRSQLAVDTHEAERVGVRSSPTWFVDGFRLRGAQSAEAIGTLVQRELADHPKDEP